MQYFGRATISRFYKFLISAFALMVFSQAAFAQATSGVTGIVSDPTGKVVPGVTVTLTDTRTDRSFTTTTNDEGSYTFTNIPPAEGYRLTFAVQGFQTNSLSNVTLGVAKVETYDTVLSAGDVSATVDIVAAGTGDTLNTTDPSIGNVIDTRQLRELPIQIRSSPAALISLQPGVVGNNIGTGNTNRVGSVTGSRADQGNITVDGIDANDQTTGQFASTVGNAPIDAIQEFRAITVNPSASEGRSSGGQVQLVTKSGTNDFHGSLRLYNRNEAFAANSFFNNRNGTPRGKLNRNQFGGNLGGPVPFPNFGERDPSDPFWNSGKDRLFFFFDYEGRRDASEVTGETRIVPLQHFRNGGLAYISGPQATCAGARLNVNPSCITILSPTQVAGLDPLGIGASPALRSFINSRYPLPNDLSLGDGLNTGGFVFNAPVSREDNTFTTRFDGNITDRQKAFLRFNIARRTQTDTVNSVAAQFPGDPAAALIVSRDWSIAAGHNWAITDSLYNQFTIGNSHSNLSFPNDFNPSFPTEFTFGTLSAPFAGIDTQSRIVDTPTIRDDATWVKGNHTLLFGFQYKPIKSVSGIVNDFNFATIGLGGNLGGLDASVQPGNLNPSAISQYDASFAFLLGRIASVNTNYTYTPEGIANGPGTGKLRDFRYNEYEYYVQDNWKIRNDLTVNLGLRYQYYSPPYEANGFQTGNDVDFNELFQQRVANAAAGIASDTSEPFLTYTLIGRANNGRPYYKGDKNNFAPRIGFAYSPSFSNGFMKTVFGDRKTSIRGGASIVYERVGGGLTFIQDQGSYLFDNSANSPFGTGDAFADLQNDPRFTGIGSLPVSNTAPIITNPLTPFVDNGAGFGNADGAFNYTIAQDFQVPYSYQYSIGFQRELPGNFLLDVSYAGRIGKKLFTQADAAQVLNFRDPGSGQFLFDALNAIQTQLQAGTTTGNINVQPFFENQVAATGRVCPAIVNGHGGCTGLVVASANRRNLIFRGDTGDLIQNLFANTVFTPNPLLGPNVGISSQFSDNVYITNLGRSRYDALLVSLQRRFSQGLQFDINYTYSFSKDNNSSVANTVIGGLVFDLTNPDAGYGPSDFDIRHIANANFIWELPFGRGKWIGGNSNGFLNTFIGGWQLSGIYTYRSGLPMSVLTNSFPVSFTLESPAVLVGDASALGGNINTSGSSVNFFGDPAAAAAALASFRNVRHGETGSRNVLRGPSFWNFDLSVAKNFSLPWEGHRIQLRMDAFNVFNRNVFANPTSLTLSGFQTLGAGGTTFGCTASSAGCNFGQITTSASTPRELQFAIRYDF
ncbi:MAG TPA: TonB-dependent receptor [Pyrinomonadaceae bacterium]|nr:TonB-dependent receptor [Pyrinomonadaceae bacterium]